MRASRLSSAAVGILIFCVACGEGKEAEKKADSDGAADTAVSAADHAEAQEIFKTRCSPCHGSGGKGDGPASSALTPKPRDFTNRGWQDEVSDGHIEKIVVYGGAAVNKSPAMPANPDLQSKAGVVKALRELIRGLDAEATGADRARS